MEEYCNPFASVIKGSKRKFHVIFTVNEFKEGRNYVRTDATRQRIYRRGWTETLFALSPRSLFRRVCIKANNKAVWGAVTESENNNLYPRDVLYIYTYTHTDGVTVSVSVVLSFVALYICTECTIIYYISIVDSKESLWNKSTLYNDSSRMSVQVEGRPGAV